MAIGSRKTRGGQPLPISIQAAFLKAAQPGSTCSFTRGSGLVWKGTLQPTPLSDIYTVRIRYGLGRQPQTDVLNPKLQRRGEQPIPHMYEQKHLCLFNPGKWNWDATMRIDQTTLLWASMWLYFYEHWLATGEWQGGGDHPE